MGNDIVTVASFDKPFEAHMARVKLEAEGIRSIVSDEHLVTMDPLLGYAVGGIKVEVSREDAAAAHAILEHVASERSKPREPDAASTAESDADANLCPRCGSDQISVHRSGTRFSWLTIVFIGFPIGRSKPQHTCGACAHNWR